MSTFPVVHVFARMTAPDGSQFWQRYMHPGNDHGEAVVKAARAWSGGYRIEEFITFGESPRYWDVGAVERE